MMIPSLRPIIKIIMVGLLISSGSTYPVRKQYGIVDRLFRPIRAMANFFTRKLSLDMYYPQQTLHPILPPSYLTGHSHYVKMPMTSVISMLPPPVTRSPQYFLHGVGYPVASMPQQIVTLQPLYRNQLFQGFPGNFQSHSPPLNPTMKPSSYPIVSSPKPDKQLPPPIQYEAISDSHVENSLETLKIVLIQPSDLQNINLEKPEIPEKLEPEIPPSLNVKGYVMKLNPDSFNNKFHIVPMTSENDSCIEPMCDPFLRKLIPELLSSSSSFQDVISSNNEDSFVIVKSLNDSVMTSDYSLSILPNPPETSVKKLEPVSLTSSIEEEPPKNEPVRAKRLHFPRKFISSKINSSSIKKYEPRENTFHKFLRNHQIKPTSKSTISGEESNESLPLPRYGSKAVQLRLRKKELEGMNEKNHYTAGLLFNKRRHV